MRDGYVEGVHIYIYIDMAWFKAPGYQLPYRETRTIVHPSIHAPRLPSARGWTCCEGYKSLESLGPELGCFASDRLYIYMLPATFSR